MSSLFESIQTRQEFESCINLLNLQDVSVFEQLLKKVFGFEIQNRIIQKTKIAQFSEAEKQKLLSAFHGETTLDQLDLTFSMLSLMVGDCVYYIAKPNLVFKRLVELRLSADLSTCFSTLWLDYAKDLVQAEKTRSALISAQSPVVQVDFSVNGSSVEPTAIFKFKTESNGSFSDVFLEANASELFKFYQELEIIQAKLDALK